MSAIFLNNITQIDYALFLGSEFVGDSVNVSVILTGDISDDEQVVVDFGTAKKWLKELIDHKQHGFDHKVLVPKYIPISGKSFNQYVVQGSSTFTVPDTAVKIIPKSDQDTPYLEHLASVVEEYLNAHVESFTVKVRLDRNIVLSDNFNVVEKFCYTHGLPESTSWGCQNIVHGHYSYVAGCAYDAEYVKKVAKHLNNKWLINSKYRHGGSAAEEFVEYSYTTERGKFHAEVCSSGVLELPYEPTVENIAQYIVDTFGKPLQDVFISEGLCKGAIIPGS